MHGVEFRELDLIGEGERGSTFEFDNRKTTDRFILLKRNAGALCGCEYHTGKHPNKNPEIGILISGTAEFLLRNANGDELRRTFDRPIIYIFHKNIYHRIRAVTDIIIIEYNAASDGAGDSFDGFDQDRQEDDTS